jgi:hypothetical protein
MKKHLYRAIPLSTWDIVDFRQKVKDRPCISAILNANENCFRSRLDILQPGSVRLLENHSRRPRCL